MDSKFNSGPRRRNWQRAWGLADRAEVLNCARTSMQWKAYMYHESLASQSDGKVTSNVTVRRTVDRGQRAMTLCILRHIPLHSGFSLTLKSDGNDSVVFARESCDAKTRLSKNLCSVLFTQNVFEDLDDPSRIILDSQL